MGACFVEQGEFDEALAMRNSSEVYLLSDKERDQATYMQAICYLEIGNLKEAAVWFEMLRETSHKYASDCTYYLSYIRYAQHRYDEALSGFLSIQHNSKYVELVPYYLAEIYLIKQQYTQAEKIAQAYLSTYPRSQYRLEMYRRMGEAAFQQRKYNEAIQ